MFIYIYQKVNKLAKVNNNKKIKKDENCFSVHKAGEKSTSFFSKLEEIYQLKELLQQENIFLDNPNTIRSNFKHYPTRH